MMVRTSDPGLLNDVANHPDVRPWLGGDGPVNLAPLITPPGNVTLMLEDGGGGFIGVQCGPGVYDIHSLFVPSLRRFSKPAMQEACAYMFHVAAARELITCIPANNRAATSLAKTAGFVPNGWRSHCWPTMGGPYGVTWWRLTAEQYAQRVGAMCDTLRG